MFSKIWRVSAFLIIALGAALLAFWALQGNPASAQAAGQTPLPGKKIPQFVQPLPLIGGTGFEALDGTSPLTISMEEFDAKILPLGTIAPGVQTLTRVWGYTSSDNPVTVPRETYLGPVIVAQRNVPTQITWVNNLGTTGTSQMTFWKNATDQTLHWADPLNGEANEGAMAARMMPGQPPDPTEYWSQNYSGPIPAAVHLHGGEIPPELDGGPDAWFTTDGLRGHGYYSKSGAGVNEAIYTYPNTQEAGMVWFHDHLLGATRLNVYAGLAGAFALTDPDLILPTGLTATGLEGQDPLIPMVIQDRMFDTTGQLYFPAGSPFTPNPDHPYWVPEFVGDTIVVNGKAWPYLSVEPRRYRFLFVNGSNARTYEMFFVNTVTKAMGPAIWQIGTDGGYLDAPVKIDPNAAVLNKLVMMPGERADVIVDFGGLPQGTLLILRNTGRTPYPKGGPPAGSTLGQIIQIRVDKPLAGADVSYNPAGGTPLRTVNTNGDQKLIRLVNPATGTLAVTPQLTRALTLNEVMGMPVTVGGVAFPGGPLEILLNNSKWDGVNPDMTTRGDFTPFPVNGVTTYYSEVPNEGDTEVWEIINLTADAHPIHTHLTQCQLINRQNFNRNNYTGAYTAAFTGGGMDYMTGQPFLPGVFMPAYGPPLNYNSGSKLGGNPDITPFLQGKAIPPAANEAGWKDTIMALPGQVTRIAIRYAPTSVAAGVHGNFLFNPNGGHGYVWHCHIIDHEDNEMMRPLAVTPKEGAIRTIVKGVDY